MYDIIIIGLGSMGSSALCHLAKAGVKVLGIEQFGISHDQGSHSGKTRIVRKAYFEHPDYVPLLEKAYQGWTELEEETGKGLFQRTGLAYFGKPNHPVLKGVKESSNLYSIPLQTIPKNEFKQFDLDSEFECLLEPDAGFALTDLTIKSLVDLAMNQGAETRVNESFINFEEHSDYISVRTSKDTYSTKKLILSTGAYINNLIDSLKIDLKVTRQLLYWIEPNDKTNFQLRNFPCWMIADDEFPGLFYGFPILPKDQPGGNGLLKVAHHTTGVPIVPSELNEFNEEEEKEIIKSVLEKNIPDALGEIKTVSACMYTNTTDENFILDFLPDSKQQIILATGFSGHGFKFVPVIGEIITELVTEGKSKLPIDFLGINRFK